MLVLVHAIHTLLPAASTQPPIACVACGPPSPPGVACGLPSRASPVVAKSSKSAVRGRLLPLHPLTLIGLMRGQQLPLQPLTLIGYVLLLLLGLLNFILSINLSETALFMATTWLVVTNLCMLMSY